MPFLSSYEYIADDSPPPIMSTQSLAVIPCEQGGFYKLADRVYHVRGQRVVRLDGGRLGGRGEDHHHWAVDRSVARVLEAEFAESLRERPLVRPACAKAAIQIEDEAAPESED